MQTIRMVIFHRPGPTWDESLPMFDQPGVEAHVAHYRQLLELGKLSMGGPYLDSDGGGMMVTVPGITQDEITRFASEDPAVISGLLKYSVRPWMIGMTGSLE